MSSAAAVRPDDPGLNDAAAGWRGCYVHIPFCARACPYCDFAIVTGSDAGTMSRYVAAVVAEVEMDEPWPPLDAVYFGGGTPSQLSAAELVVILDALDARFGLAAHAEVSLEANPEDWSEEFARPLAAAGFTRVSFGAQSFDPAVLASLGRRHTPADVERAVGAARDAGFASVNLDLIFGDPAETGSSWSTTLARALALAPDHLSLYALTVERGTPLSRSVAAGAAAPDPDVQADAYDHALAVLDDAGYIRYETSNFARPGHHCRYNLLTWAQGEYLAYGNGAHGHRNGRRFRNVRRLDAYLDAVEAGRAPRAGSDPVTGWAAEQERLLLGLRRACGVVSGRGGAALVGSAWGSRLVDAGVIARSGDRLRVARPLLGDEAARAVLALEAGDC